MDIVAHTASVLGVIILAENTQILALAVRHLQNDGDKVGFRVMSLADIRSWMRAAGVKVSQRDISDAVSLLRPVEHTLHCKLGLAVAVCRAGFIRFQNGNTLRLAIGCGSRGENNIFHAMLNHRLKHSARAAEVVIIIL